MKSELELLFAVALAELQLPKLKIHVTRPENPDHGEYTTNIAFLVGKELHSNPIQIAQQIVTFLQEKKQDNGTSESSENYKAEFEILRDIKSLAIAGPGFINVSLESRKLSSTTAQVINDKEAYGTRQFGEYQEASSMYQAKRNVKDEKFEAEEGKRRVVVEFTDPNPFKEMHIGHLYSNAVGESLSRLLESQGNEVRRVCYQGDVGMHVAKALWGMKQKVAGSKQQVSTDEKEDITTEKILTEMESRPLAERAKWLGEAYAIGAQAFEDNPQAQEEMKVLNTLGFMAAQKMHQESGWKATIDYASLLSTTPHRMWSGSTSDVELLYTTGRRWSLEYFETIYKRLGTTFQAYYFESMVGELGYNIVKQNISNNIFTESEGAIIYEGEKKGLHTRVFINKLGLPTYEAKELGLAPKKYEDWPYDQSVIITGKEIDEYFKVLLSALSDINTELASKTTHISHGMVRLPEGKMSSRKGNVLTAEWLLNAVNEQMQKVVEQNQSIYNKEEQKAIVEHATIAAVKYSLLKVSLPSDISFDLQTSVSMDGDSGPYLLYTYARAKSVLRKAEESSKEHVVSSKQDEVSLNTEEHMLAKLILYFPEIVGEAADSLSPSTVSRYLIDLAQSFNLFYAKHKIMGNESSFRLQLAQATSQVLKNGLHLLGIETVERM